MRYREIISEKGEIVPVIDPKKLAKAEAEGFDTSRIWYHGTKRKFSTFRIPNNKGIDELGRGIYVTQYVGTANVWAQGMGQVLSCVLRKGKLIEMTDMPTSGLWSEGSRGHDLWREAYRGYKLFLVDEYSEGGVPNVYGEPPEIDYREFAEKINRGQIKLSNCLSRIGYIGATNRDSQIRGQAVIWNPEDVRIVGKAPGFDGYVSEAALSSSAQALLDRIPETGSIKINLDGSVMSTLRSLDALLDYKINTSTFQAVVSRKAEPVAAAPAPTGISIDMLPAVVKADILDMCLGPNGPKAFEEFWVEEHGIMSFTETYLSQFLFGEENLNTTGGGGALTVEKLTLRPDELDNSRRSVSDLVVGQYSALRSKAPPILVRHEANGWKLVEGGHRLAAAKARGDATIDAIDVSQFFTLSKDDWHSL